MKLAIYGAGGMGAEFLTVADAVQKKENKWEEIIFVDDNKKNTIYLNHKLYTFNEVLDTFDRNDIEFVVSVGEPIVREQLASRIENAGFRLGILIYPRQDIPYGVVFEPGVVVMTPMIGLGSFSHFGKNVLIQGFASVGHETYVGANTNISCFVQISGGCHIGKNVFFGIQSVVKEGITIGDNVIIGMSAPVLRDVPNNYTVFHPLSRMVEHEPGTRALGKKNIDE